MAVFSNLVAILRADSTAFEKGTQRARKSLYGLQQESATTQRALLGLAKSATAFLGIGVGIYGVRRALSAVSQEAIGFEYSLAKLSTMLDAQSMKSLPMLRREIEKLSIQYGKGTEDLNEATYKILSNQIAVSKAMKVLEENIKAARGGFTDVATTVQASVGLLRSYRLEEDKISYVTNMMQKIVERGNLQFEDVAQNIGTVSSAAAALKVDLEALGAVIATLTRAGVPIDQTFTAIRNILLKFKDPTPEAIKAAWDLGFALNETSIQGAGLIKVFEKLVKANAKQLGALMPTARGFTGFAAGLQNATEMGRDYEYMLSDVNAVQEAFNKAVDTAAFNLDKARQGLEATKRAAGESLGLKEKTKEISEFSQNMADATRNITGWIEKYREWRKEINAPIEAIEQFGPTGGRTEETRGGLFRNYGATGTWEEFNYLEPPIEALNAAILKQINAMPKLIEEFKQFQGPLPGTEGVMEATLGKTDELIRKMQRENELAAITGEERAKALAIDKYRQAVLKDIEGGMKRSKELTIEERQAVENLAAEQYRLSKQQIQSTMDIAQAYVNMFDSINDQSAESFAWRKRLIEEEMALYEKQNFDSDLIKKVRDEKLMQLRMDQPQTLFEGMAAGVEQFRRELGTLPQLLRDITKEGLGGMSRALTDSIMGARDLKDALSDVGRQLTSQLLNFAIGNALTGGAGLLGISLAHGGGMIGQSSFPTRAVPPAIFAGAPRLHEGLRSDELPVIVQTGEEIRSRTQVAQDRRGGSAGIEQRLDAVIALLSRRQTINAKIVDHRDVVTSDRMEGREGERFVMRHVERNGR